MSYARCKAQDSCPLLPRRTAGAADVHDAQAQNSEVPHVAVLGVTGSNEMAHFRVFTVSAN